MYFRYCSALQSQCSHHISLIFILTCNLLHCCPHLLKYGGLFVFFHFVTCLTRDLLAVHSTPALIGVTSMFDSMIGGNVRRLVPPGIGNTYIDMSDFPDSSDDDDDEQHSAPPHNATVAGASMISTEIQIVPLTAASISINIRDTSLSSDVAGVDNMSVTPSANTAPAVSPPPFRSEDNSSFVQTMLARLCKTATPLVFPTMLRSLQPLSAASSAFVPATLVGNHLVSGSSSHAFAGAPLPRGVRGLRVRTLTDLRLLFF
jgi:hypothetical protein